MQRSIRAFVIGPVVVVIAVGLILAMSARLTDGRRPSLFGFDLLVVTSGSMEPTLSPGDLVLVDRGSTNHEVGDLIVFRPAPDIDLTVTHRVVGIETNSDGSRAYVTRGDANPRSDSSPVVPEAVVGEVSASVPHLGRVLFGVRRLDFLIPMIVGLALFDLGSRLWRVDPAAVGTRGSMPMERNLSPTNSTNRSATNADHDQGD